VRAINHDNPTPCGWGYQLPNPEKNGNPVYFDDCQQSTGMMVEAKGNYAGVLSFEPSRSENSAEWLETVRSAACRSRRAPDPLVLCRTGDKDVRRKTISECRRRSRSDRNSDFALAGERATTDG